jgi:hypothetical protein
LRGSTFARSTQMAATVGSRVAVSKNSATLSDISELLEHDGGGRTKFVSFTQEKPSAPSEMEAPSEASVTMAHRSRRGHGSNPMTAQHNR